MNKLSIESINAKAPYKVKFEPETGAYLFTSDSNIDYLVDFTLDNLVKSDKAYQFVRKSQDSRCPIKRHRCAIYIYDFGFKSTSSNDDKLVQ